MSIPYIGITDFMCFDQVEQMLSVFEKHRKPNQDRRLHVGVMMSYKTLHGFPTKWSKVFPSNETVASIFSSDETMNCLHYADYTATNVYESLTKAIQFGGDGINALQLDMVWPDPKEVQSALLVSGKNLEVILQIGATALRAAGNNPELVSAYLGGYQGIVSHVLLDKSMGRGVSMDADELLPYIYEIRQVFPEMGISVAGGLGPDTIELLEPITQKFPRISIDAQGQLRPSGNARFPIHWGRAKNYLTRALEFLD